MDIHSAPVWDPQQNSYVGMIDVVDIVEFVIQTFEKSDIVGEEFVSMMEQVERFASACVSQVVGEHGGCTLVFNSSKRLTRSHVLDRSIKQ